MAKLISTLTLANVLDLAVATGGKLKFQAETKREFFIESLGDDTFKVQRWDSREAVTMSREVIIGVGEKGLFDFCRRESLNLSRLKERVNGYK